MSEATIDRLQIQIEAEASKGSKGLEKFIHSVEKLLSITSSGMDGLTKLSNSFKNINSTIQPLVEKINSVNMPLKELQASVKSFGSTDIGALKMQAQIARLQASLDRSALSSARAKIGLDKLAESQRKAAEAAKFRSDAEKQLDNIVNQAAAKQYNPSKSIQDAMPSFDGANKGYQMATSLEELQRKIAGTTASIEEATRRANEAFYRLDGSTGATLDNINAKIEFQRQKLIQLNQQYLSTVEKFGSQSSRAVDIQGKMTGVESTINGLVNKSNKLAESLRGVDSAAASATNQMKNLSLVKLPNTSSLSKPEDLTITLAKLDAMKEAQSVKDLSSEYGGITKKIFGVKNAMLGKNKTLKDQTAATKKEKSAITTLGDSMGKLVKKILLVNVAYRALRKAFQFVSDGIKAAISAPEIENMFNVAFGSMAYEADQFARKLKDAFGVDIIASKQMLATFQNFQISMGIGSQTATKMSKSLTQLSYDMASLYEMDPKQVFENLQSGLQGMPRALYKYGIAITDANIKQTALRHGLIKQGQEMSSQQKVIARYIAILEQTKTSQGDLARTLDNPANQLRVFKSQMVAAGRAIGEAFIPLIQMVLPWLNTLAVVLERAGNAFARFTYKLFGRDFDAEMKAKQDSLKGLTDVMGGVANTDDDLANGMDKAAKAAKNLISGFDELNILAKKTDDSLNQNNGFGMDFDVPELPEPTGQSPYEKMADDFFNKINSMFQSIKDFWDKYFAKPFAETWAKIKPQLEALKETFKGIFEDIKTLAEPLESWFFEHVIPMLQQLIETGGEVISGLLEVANTVISDVWEALFPMIESFVVYALPVITDFVTEAIKTFGTLFNEVKTIFLMIWNDAIRPILDLISSIWQDVMRKISDAWDEWGQPIFEKLREAIVNTSETLQNVWNTVIKPVLDQVFQVLGDLWGRHLSPLADKIIGFALNFVDAALQIYNGFILPIVNWFVDTFGPPIAEVISFIIRVIGDALGTIIDVAGGIIEALTGIINFVTGVLTGDWSRAWEGIKQIASGSWDAIKSLFSGAISTLQGIISTFASWFSSAWNALWSTASSLFSSIWNGIKSTGSALVSSIKQIITGFIDSVKSFWSSGWNGIKNTFSNVWDGMKNVASRAIDSIKGFVTGLIDKVKDAINWVKDLIGLNKEADRTSQSSRSSKSSRSIDTYSFERSVAPLREQTVSFRALSPVQTIAPAVETFGATTAVFKAEPTVYADGTSSESGIVSGYQKAQNNSPSKNVNAKDAVIAANAELANTMYQMATMIVEAIESNGVEISADSKGIFKAVKKEAGNYKRVTGSPAF